MNMTKIEKTVRRNCCVLSNRRLRGRLLVRHVVNPTIHTSHYPVDLPRRLFSARIPLFVLGKTTVAVIRSEDDKWRRERGAGTEWPEDGTPSPPRQPPSAAKTAPSPGRSCPSLPGGRSFSSPSSSSSVRRQICCRWGTRWAARRRGSGWCRRRGTATWWRPGCCWS